MSRTIPPKPSLSHEQAIFIAQAAKGKKAEDVMVLKVDDLTSLADFFIFASGESERQVRGLAAFIEKSVSTRYHTLPVMEGKETATWILLDYGDIIVHIFRPVIANKVVQVQSPVFSFDQSPTIHICAANILTVDFFQFEKLVDPG